MRARLPTRILKTPQVGLCFPRLSSLCFPDIVACDTRLAAASGANELWVTVRAKTTDKRTREVTTKRWGFKASRAGVTIGSDPGASICIDDASLSGEHAQICLTDSGDVGVVTLGRTYLLIGQGDRSAGPVPLAKDTVMKLGACSLQVQRGREATGRAPRRPRTLARVLPAQVSETCALRGVVSGGAGGAPPSQPKRRPSRADVACYICFEETEEDPAGNPLVTQPCACAKRVHRGCLARWISARGSRLCSICKARLPIDFTVEPPYIVVQVRGRVLGCAHVECAVRSPSRFSLLTSPPPSAAPSGRAPHARPLVGGRARVHRVLRAPPHGLHHRRQRRRVRPRAAGPVPLAHALAHLVQAALAAAAAAAGIGAQPRAAARSGAAPGRHLLPRGPPGLGMGGEGQLS